MVVFADELVERALLCVGLAAAAAHGAAPAHDARAHRVRRVEAAPAHPKPRPPARAHAQTDVLLYKAKPQ